MKINLTDLSYKMIMASAVLFFIGISLGTIVDGLIFSAVIGVWLAILGIIVYIASELMGPVKSNGENVRKEER